MSSRTCTQCGKKFAQPCRLKVHQQRKTPCAPILDDGEQTREQQGNPNVCKFCNRRYASRHGLSHHMRTTCKIAGSEGGMEKLYEHTLKRQLESQAKQIEQLQEQMSNMRTFMTAQAGTTSSQPVVTTNVTLGNTNTVIAQQTTYNAPVSHHHTYNINVFGSEQLPHIDRQVVKAIMDTAMGASQSPTNAAHCETPGHVYSDPDHPENLTCYLPNKKHDTVMVHGESGWEVQPMQLVVPPMATKCCDVLFMNQPFEHAERYGDLMTALRYNENAFKDNREMRTVLVRNKILLEQALGTLPITK